MPKIYTTNDLLRFIYQETNPAESAAIESEIKTNSAFAEEFEKLSFTIGELDDAAFVPHPTSVNIIMEYSQKLHEPAH